MTDYAVPGGGHCAAWTATRTITLLGAIVRGTPSLSEAACVGQYELYDDVPGRQSRDQRRER